MEALSSVQVVSQVLTKNSSKSFLRSLGIKPVGSSTSTAPHESELREQLAVKARAAVQDELDALKKRSDDANEKLERQQREMKEMRKQAEMTQKEMQENNALLKRLLSFNNVSST
jgi:polyhydroxyalkanoate synthesis regulator phasin